MTENDLSEHWQGLDLTGRRVLLVGGAGFIGHNLGLSIARQGGTVGILDSLNVNNLLSLHDSRSTNVRSAFYRSVIEERLRLIKDAGISLYIDDARDQRGLEAVVDAFAPDTVIVLAAVSHASRANISPMRTFENNSRTLEATLEAVRGKIQHLVFLSSSMVYGNFPTASVDETSPCAPIGIYGAVKLGNEKLIAAYDKVFDLPYTIVRPSALYGARCISRRVGQIFVENALSGQDLVIQGDGEDRIDFTYIDDLVQGICRCLVVEDAKGEVFNLTYGNARSLNDLAGIVTSHFPAVSIRHLDRSALVPERGTLDVSKARELLGYEPRFDIELGFDRYVNWYRAFTKLSPLATHGDDAAQVNE